ncbi:hypothetical protein QE152_g36662 [Popillia japonica]|uniref:HTH psq-type domain-containing protein n=1 Tax=Popillia japonica TaxID=7064 RepID=A0AAW1ICV1_POPJA
MAVLEVISDGGKIRSTAPKYDIDKMTLSRYIQKYKNDKSAEVTNSPQEIEKAPSTSHQNEDVENSEILEPTTPTTSEADSCNSPSVESLKSTLIRTPQEVRPYPKAAPRKQKAGRKPGKTRIVTDTPEKFALEEKYKKRYQKNPTRNLTK